MRNHGKNIKHGAISSGDVTVEPQGTITSMANSESECVKGGVEALRRSWQMLDLLLQDYTPSIESRFRLDTNPETLDGQQSENKTLIVGTLSKSELDLMARSEHSRMSALRNKFLMKEPDRDWDVVGPLKEL